MRKIKRGQIYYADLPKGIGSEQGGCRPVLIMQNDIGNRYSPTTIIAAMTSKQSKHWLPSHIVVHAKGRLKKSTVLLEQIRTTDKVRLQNYVGAISTVEMEHIEKALQISFGIQ